MRLRAEIWVKAYIRGCAAEGVAVMVTRHGDDDAGAVFVKINRLDGTARLFGPAPASLDGTASEQSWTAHLDDVGTTEREVDAFVTRQAGFDPDIWVLEVEDPPGRHFLGDWLRKP
jgi:hypothetical protein